MEDVIESNKSELTKMKELLKETEIKNLEIEKKYENILLQSKVCRVCYVFLKRNIHVLSMRIYFTYIVE